MSDLASKTFLLFLHELGEELFGGQWLWIRPHVERWAEDNPDRVAWLEHRLRLYLEDTR